MEYQPTRFVVEDKPLLDSNTGTSGPVALRFTGTCRLHPWQSRKGEMVMDGAGVARMTSGDVYEGEVRLGMFEGQGRMAYANGDVYDGEWAAHRRHGFGTLVESGGACYVGTFRDGEKDGMAEEQSDAGVYVGVYRRGHRHGIGRVKLRSGVVIDGVFKAGLLHGTATITYASGDVFVATFVDGEIHGEGQYVQAESGDTYIERFEHNVCVQGVLEPGEDPVLLPPEEQPRMSVEAERARAARRAAVHERTQLGGKDRTCTVVYRRTGDRYSGGWARSATGANRRGVRCGRGVMQYANGDVFEGMFEDDLREGRGTLRLADYFRMEKQRALEERRRINGVVIDDDVAEVAAFWFNQPPTTQEASPRPPFPLTIECDFHRDLLHGKALVTLSDGSTVEEFYCKGLRDGISHLHPASPAFRGEIRSAMFRGGVGGAVDYHLRSGADGAQDADDGTAAETLSKK